MRMRRRAQTCIGPTAKVWHVRNSRRYITHSVKAHAREDRMVYSAPHVLVYVGRVVHARSLTTRSSYHGDSDSLR